MPRMPLWRWVARGRTAMSHHPTTLPSASATKWGARSLMLSFTYARVSASGGASSSARYLRSRATLSIAAVALFPVLPVLAHDRHVLDRPLVEAARVHAVAVGVRARGVEGLHAAHRAEEVPRGAGVERVRAERLGAREELEPLLRRDEVKVPQWQPPRCVSIGQRYRKNRGLCGRA